MLLLLLLLLHCFSFSFPHCMTLPFKFENKGLILGVTKLKEAFQSLINLVIGYYKLVIIFHTAYMVTLMFHWMERGNAGQSFTQGEYNTNLVCLKYCTGN